MQLRQTKFLLISANQQLLILHCMLNIMTCMGTQGFHADEKVFLGLNTQILIYKMKNHIKKRKERHHQSIQCRGL